MVAISPPPRLRPIPYPTVVLGLASLGGVVGLLAGILVGFQVFGAELPDEGEVLPPLAMAGAGAGWILGAVAGRGLARGRRGIGRPMAIALWVGAGVVLAIGIDVCVLAARLPPDYRAAGGGPSALQVLTLADTAIAAVTVAALGRRHVPDASAPERRGLGAVAVVGILAGAVLSGLLLFGFLDEIERIDRDRTRRAAESTAWNLLENAERHRRRTGAYPRDAAGLLWVGADVPPGAQVEFAGAFADGFCIVVGRDVGETLAEPPIFTGFTWPRGQTPGHIVREGSSCRLVSMRAHDRTG